VIIMPFEATEFAGNHYSLPL